MTKLRFLAQGFPARQFGLLRNIAARGKHPVAPAPFFHLYERTVSRLPGTVFDFGNCADRRSAVPGVAIYTSCAVIPARAKLVSMPEHPQLQITRPEEKELERKRGEHAVLETNLTERELQLASLRAETFSFERKYLAEVGLRYAELDDLKAKLAEKAAAANPDDTHLQDAARKARERSDETRSTAGPDDHREHKIFSPTPELKRLYRDVARRVHPDLTSDREDRARRQELMAEANHAYERGDEEGLARVFAAYECAPENVQGDGAGPELIRTIRRISQAKSRLVEIEAESDQLLRSDAHQLRLRFDESARQGRDLFADLAQSVEEKIARTRLELEQESAVTES
ncbi:MAG: J domain-containing protein [Candidatus Acidiferrales bacterium]